MVYKVVFLRHGESQWNKENRFTGWTNVDLSEAGEMEAVSAGNILKEKGFTFDVAYTSFLKRAIKTCWKTLEILDLCHIPVLNRWRLNERHYGNLQGLNKIETAQKHGDEQVKIWRRAYAVPPPTLDSTDKRHPVNDPVYSKYPAGMLPGTECLKDTVERALPTWFDEICVDILNGKNVLVAAHGNSLRAICKHLDGLSEAQVLELNIPTGVPLVYELDEKLNVIKHYYLMDEAELKKRIEAVASQGKAK